MTNSQSHQTIDCTIGNLHFELSVDRVPAPVIKEICGLHHKICTGYDFFDQ